MLVIVEAFLAHSDGSAWWPCMQQFKEWRAKADAAEAHKQRQKMAEGICLPQYFTPSFGDSRILCL
jgi:hypothetical protein